MKKIGIALLGLVVFGLATSCLEGTEMPSAEEVLADQLEAVDQTQLASDIETIDNYLVDNSVAGVIKEEHGVRYVIHSLGTGAMPKLRNRIKFDYAGKFLSSGSEFDSANGLIYPLSGLIVGWKLVLPLVPEGTTMTMYIPSGLAYGPNDLTDGSGAVVIPANSNLIFDLTFTSIE